MQKLSDLLIAHGITEFGAVCEKVGCSYWPMEHQANTLRKYAKSAGFLDASDPGTGKTLPAQINAIRLVSLKHKVIFCMPPKLLTQFEREFEEVFPGIRDVITLANLNVSSEKKRKLISEWDDSGWPDILLLSYDVYRTLNDKSNTKAVGQNLWRRKDGSPYFKEKGVPFDKDEQPYTRDGRPISKRGRAANSNKMKLREVGYNVMFCDEAHALCGTDSLLSQSAKEMQESGCKLYLMTGTPIPTHLEDIYGLIRLVNHTAYSDKFQFLRKHTETSPLVISRGGKQATINRIVGYKKTEEIFEKLYSNAVRVQKRDVVTELKDPVVTNIPLRLDAAHIKLYRQLVTEQFTILGDNVLSPDNESALRHTALQIVTSPESFGFTGKNNVAEYCDELLSTINPVNNKVILFAYYKNTILALKERYKEYNPAVIFGGSSDPKAEIAKFVNDDTCRIAVINWKSGGAGLNLQVASHIIFYECPTSPGDAKQAIARCDRKGQKEIVNVYFLRVLGTLLDKNFKSLIKNETEANKVLKDKKDLLSEYFTN